METVDKPEKTGNLVTKLYFRLLPIQILLAAISAVNDLVSSLFASNYVGAAAMGVVGLYSPINMLLSAICTMMVSGSQILCGKHMGANQIDCAQGIFSTDILLAAFFGGLYVLLHVLAAMFNWLNIFTADPEIRKYLSQYVLGKAIGILPFIIGQQFSVFLSLENKVRRTTIASVAFIIVNLIANFIFVQLLRMEIFGIALASSCGLWAFLLIQLSYYLGGKSYLFKFSIKKVRMSDFGTILLVGIAGALTYIYQALRGVIANVLINKYAGSAGLSAFATVNSFLGLFWAIPSGMMTVSRMLMSVYIGEEDRRGLTDVMRNMFRWCLPLMSAVIAAIVLLAGPITNLYYHVPGETIYNYTLWGIRLMAIVMPVAVVEMHFMCYAQTSGKQLMIQLYGVIDGVAGVIGFSLILMPFMSMNGMYLANILNSAFCIGMAVVYSIIFNKRFPRNMDDLMAIPAQFGVSKENRMELTIRKLEDVVTVANTVSRFCREHGMDERRTYLSSLFLEEMAGNVVEHGFIKDKKKNHEVGIRVSVKGDIFILRINDDCIPFNPEDRKDIFDPNDPAKNMGLRMVYHMARKIEYHNILGLNVLTIQV